MKLTTRRTLLVAGAVAASIFFATVLARGRTSRSEPLSDRVPNAAVSVARRTTVRSTLTLSGEFKPFQEVDLHAKIAGYIRTISVDVGDRVHDGPGRWPSWRSLSWSRIETSITGRFERFFTLGSDIDHIESRSLPGVSLIKIYFHPGSDAECRA